MKLHIKFGKDISIGSRVISIVLLIYFIQTDRRKRYKVSHRGAPLLKITQKKSEVQFVFTVDDTFLSFPFSFAGSQASFLFSVWMPPFAPRPAI